MNKRWRKRKGHAKCILCKPYWFCICAFERTSTCSQQSHCQTLSRTVSWKLARDINWHPASATSALSFSLGWEPRGSVWSTAKTTALVRIFAFCLDKPCWKESWRAKIVAHWKGNPPWWFWFGPGYRMVHCLAATLRWSETLNFSMSSAPLCQVLAQITAVNHRVPNNFYKTCFRVREFRGPLDQIEKKNIQPLLRYEIQLLRFEATGFWCRWKNIKPISLCTWWVNIGHPWVCFLLVISVENLVWSNRSLQNYCEAL